MAINPVTRYPGKINPASADYPFGEGKNVTSVGARDGTPVDADMINDMWGFFQGLLSNAGITPNGSPDTAVSSQYRSGLQIMLWRAAGDVRGWGAVCDGVTDDSAAIAAAISATNGDIVLPGKIKVTTHVLSNAIQDVKIRGYGKSEVVIDDDFVFNPSYRGIFVFDSCTGSVEISGIKITGAKLDKLNAAEPWQDGDAGVEFVHCSGRLLTENMDIRDVKTWGVIHVECPNADSTVRGSYFKNCQVQSGVGGTGYKSLEVSDCEFDDIGLYGVESETRDRNAETSVFDCIARLCNKGFATVHNSDKILVSACRTINCRTGISFLSADSADPSFLGNYQTAQNCIATSCKTSFEMIYPHSANLINCTEDRDDIDYFVRTRALDRIIKFISGKPYIALDSASENPGLTVGMVIQMDDGVQYTIATVDGSVTPDATFGNLIGFTTTVSLPTSYLRSSFRRYVEVSTDKTSVVLYGGSDVNIKGNKFAWATQIFASFGDHVNLNWLNNTSYSCANYFAVGLAGTVSGSVRIEYGENLNISGIGSGNKFAGVLSAQRTYVFRGGTTNAQTAIQHAVATDNAFIGKVKLAINSGQTTAGTIALRLNGSDVITGGLTGTPLRATVTQTALINVSDVFILQLTDDVGDLIASGYSVKFYGAFL